MEIKNYLQILIRWTWLLLFCMLLGIGGGYVISRLANPTYQATTKILVSKDLSDQNSQFAAMTTQQLIDAYVQLLSSSSIVDDVSQRLNTKIDIKSVAQIQQVRSTPVIQIVIEDNDPQQAAAIANTLVEVLIDQSTQASGYTDTEASLKNRISQVEEQIFTLQTEFNQISDEKLQSQLNQVNNQITTLQDEISTLSTEIGSLDSLLYPTAEQNAQLTEKRAQLAQLQSLLTQYQQVRINLEYFGRSTLNSGDPGDDVRMQLLQSTLDHYQAIYLDLLDDLQTVQLAHLRSTPTIETIEKATPPTSPIRPRPIIYSMLGGIIGLILAVGIAFIIEYLDDTLKTSQDVQQALNIPVLGHIANKQSAQKTMGGEPTAWQFKSETSEPINALRTNLEFSVGHPPLKSLLLLGVNKSGEGKTSIAVDLAISYAQAGSKVVLLDANLRNPSVHHYFGLDNEIGFSNLLAGDLKADVAGKKVDDTDKIPFIVAGKKVEGIDGLTVITGGNATPAPATEGVTIPNRIIKILDILKNQSDVVIIDAPPINVADSWVLASKVDGVLLVIQPRATHPADARQSLEQLHRAGATLLGAVLYHIPRNLAYYYRKMLHRHRTS